MSEINLDMNQDPEELLERIAIILSDGGQGRIIVYTKSRKVVLEVKEA